jgi:hypothetical protein
MGRKFGMEPSYAFPTHFIQDRLTCHMNSAKKRNVLSLSIAFIFSKLNMCKYLYEHNKIQQRKHKLNMFHSVPCNAQRWDCLQWQQAQSVDAVTHRLRPWWTLHLQIDPAPQYRPRCNAHSFNDKRESDHHPLWDKTATRQWNAPFASPVWSSDGGFVPIGDIVAGDVWWGPALQQAYKPSIQNLSTYCGQSWALMEGLCIPGVTRAVVVPILYLSRRCDVWMYRSCAAVVTSCLPLRGW